MNVQARVLMLLAATAAATGSAQKPIGETLAFHFERPGLPVPEYTFNLQKDGTGTYTASYSSVAPPSKYAPTYPGVAAPPPTPTMRTIALSAKTAAMLFDRARSADSFRTCESKLKNIADTGSKTITYTTADGSMHCTYNYTENKSVAGITETFQGIAETLDEGRSLDLKHRYDRLGLDHELSILVDNVKEGRALEVATIAPVLQSLCDDMQVMDRVRKRAAGLLQAATH